MSKLISPFNAAQFVEIYDNLDIPEDYCNRMIKHFNSVVYNGSGLRGENQFSNPLARKDLSISLSDEDSGLTNQTFFILQQALERYAESHPALASKTLRCNTIKVQKTSPKGGYHVFHSENSNSPDAILRMLVWTIYLNDLSEGEGCTEFLEQGISVHPAAGRVVLFPADWTHTHRGNPTYNQDKYIATGWYLLR